MQNVHVCRHAGAQRSAEPLMQVLVCVNAEVGLPDFVGLRLCSFVIAVARPEQYPADPERTNAECLNRA